MRPATVRPDGDIAGFVTPASFRRPTSVFDSAWVEHAPFAFWLVDALRPRLVVELGVWTGFSFLTFCDAVQASRLDARCVGVDTWEGDVHAGLSSPGDVDALAACAARFGDAAELVEGTFDSATARFEPGTIDLLHIDGLHTYEAVRHDVDTWLGRLSGRGVVVLHDSEVQARGFGVWRVVEELRAEYPTFTFTHGFGLAAVGIGLDVPDPVKQLLALDDASAAAHDVRAAYARLGGDLTTELRAAALLRHLSHVCSDRELLSQQTAALRHELDVRNSPGAAGVAARGRRLGRTLEAGAAGVGRRTRWAWRQTRRALRLAWWTATLQLPRRLEERRLRVPPDPAPTRDYETWVAQYDTLTPEDVGGMERLVAELPRRPLVSLLMPVRDPPVRALQEAIESVLAQAYQHWELCLCDDGSTDADVRRSIEQLAARDDRVIAVRREEPAGRSSASNRALTVAGGELCGLVDDDGVLRPHALLLMVKQFVEQPDLALVYSDEDELDPGGRRREPFFKPDWSPALLESQNYLGRFLMFRTDLARRVGAFRSAYDGAQDWDLVLRLTDAVDRQQVGHVPHVLYHRRTHGGSAAQSVDPGPGAARAGRKAIVDHLARCGRAGAVTDGEVWPRVRVLPRPPLPPVSVVIPTTARAELLAATLDGLLHRTRYPDFEIVLAIHRSTLDDADRAANLRRAAEDARVRVHVHDVDPFDYARVNNEAVAATGGSHVLLLNDDVEVVEAGWLETLVGQAQGDAVGAVGALLEFPDGRIQHGGVMLASIGPCHAYGGLPVGLDGYHGRLRLAHDVTAATGACLLVSREAFDAIGGFDTQFAVAYNDVDLCLRLRERGYRVVLAPLARLVHVEAASFGSHVQGRAAEWKAESDLIHERWAAQMGADCFHNPNLADDPVHPERIAFPPRVAYPWRSPVHGG